mgnify:CR=1 FL=1
MQNVLKRIAGLFLGFALTVGVAQAEELKPFILAYTDNGDMAAVVADVREKLTGAGFEIVGSYQPYDDGSATVIGVTNDTLKQEAARTEFGGYGVVQRVTVTDMDGQLQVAYTHPTYMAHAYRMAGDLAGVTAQLEGALGREQQYGPDEGMSPDDLREYHYMFGMEYFDDPSELAEYDSYEAGIEAVEASLAKGTAGVTKVYRVDIPGKDQTVFGVAMDAPSEDDQYMDDEYIMSEIDFKDLRSTGHLPYEILVSGDESYALYARFRIAINFPDLSMMGSHSFMNIMDSPGAIEKALIQAAGGELTAEHW